MKKRFGSIACSIIIMISMLLTGVSSFAAEIITQDDIDKLEEELEAIKKRQESTEKALAEIEKDENYVESAVLYCEQLISGYAEYVLLLSKIISEYDAAIGQTNDKIAELQEKNDEIYEIYLVRLRMSREDSTYSVLELVFSSAGLTELISALERASDVIDYDKRVMRKLEEQRKLLAAEVNSLEKFKRSQQDQIDGYELLKDSVKTRVDELNAQLLELQNKKDEAENQKTLDQILEEEADKALDQLIKDYIEQQESSAQYAVGEEFIWPLDDKWNYISSPFGYRIHPVYGVPKGHKGIDIPASKGENIYAALSGKVVTSVYSPSYGYYIIIDHGLYGSTGKRLYTLYAHSSKLIAKEGQMVKQGDVIAKVGTTGTSTGNHLHFEIKFDSTPVDPLSGYVKVPK